MEISGAGPSFVCDNQFGEISVQATSRSLARLEARTSYAALNVRLPSALKPSIQAHTTYGAIESDFPVVLKSSSEVSQATQETGVPAVSLRNQNGKIRVISE
jgi:hypothetical protein